MSSRFQVKTNRLHLPKMKPSLAFFLLLSTNSFCQDRVQELLNPFQDSLMNYGLVALVDDGAKKESGAVGWASEDNPISIDNRFCIGSVTKMYTATLVLKLQELGQMNIQDPISKYIEHHAFIDGEITVKQLLNHTSGLMDISDAKLANIALLEPDKDYNDAYLLSLITAIDFDRGTKYAYSNTNYFLLRKIIEKITDNPYRDVLTELIIDPLQLASTFPYHSNEIEGLAHPILGDQDLHEISKTATNRISVGIGNIVSDANDVNTFLRALFIDKTILNEESLSQMTNFQRHGKTKIGLGVFEESFGGKTVYDHTGRAISYIAYAHVDVESGTSYVLLCNNANDPYIDEAIENVCE